MERIDVHTTTAGAADLAYIEGALYRDDAKGGELVCHLRGDMYLEERRFYVGWITTEGKHRRSGSASRLLVHIIDLFGVRVLAAGTVNEEADAFFVRLAQRVEGLSLELD
ncbi:hypothetical protein [Microbacterium binotii]|uniref:hypothetical protein n=1 Tax=Microbacterium binotii TaxID=462710 RepID=UPI001F303882|nr:hypothetical protein [Microbacterium binotii]UIN30932.1 hypothetical protein LXM64_01615 [Microbacterium binotii]